MLVIISWVGILMVIAGVVYWPDRCCGAGR